VIVNYGEDSKTYNIPVGAHLSVEPGEQVKAGQILVKIRDQSPQSNNFLCTYGSRTGSGGFSNGLSSNLFKSIFTRRFNLRKATRFDKHQPYLALAFRYFKINIVIIAVQICINTAFGDVPRNDLIFNSCLISLKNCSISHLALYRSDMVFAVQEN